VEVITDFQGDVSQAHEELSVDTLAARGDPHPQEEREPSVSSRRRSGDGEKPGRFWGRPERRRRHG
jgi:hypothetical protein